jgi:ABC-type glycerol-3-phosphate transport system permease component
VRSGWRRRLVTAAAAAAVTTACLFPVVWMALSSFKLPEELYSAPPTWLPAQPTLLNYGRVLLVSNIPRYLVNSLIISVGSTALALPLAVFAAYGFARFRFPGRRASLALVLAGQFLPTAAIVVPLFVALRALGLVNTYLGLILVYLVLTLPLSVWMLTGYFRAVPAELEEAALVDGASRLAVLFRITLPLSLPGVLSVFVYAFVTTWNEFVFALVFARDPHVKTLPIAIAELMSEVDTDWGAVAAASLVMALPILVAFLLMQRHFVRGITAGAVKG